MESKEKKIIVTKTELFTTMPKKIINKQAPPDETQLVVNGEYDATKPKLFRTTSDRYLYDRLKMLVEGKVEIIDANGDSKTWSKIPPRDGLNDLYISGSTQFNLEGLDWVVEQIEKRGIEKSAITMVDLREESHCILNGQSVSWYNPKDDMNVGKENLEVEKVEASHVEWLRQQNKVKITQIKQKYVDHLDTHNDREVKVSNVLTERHMVRDLKNLGYIRIPITDHLKPEADDGDTIRFFVDSQPEGVWNHFHCCGGKGRTTTLMVLYDMMHNWKNSTLTVEDFVIRHWLLGGINLFGPPGDVWTAEAKYERVKFIRKYYQYIQEMGSGDRIYFQTWLSQHN